MLDLIYFVTSNKNKLREVQEILNFPVKSVKIDLDEIQSTDLDELISHKLQQAYEQVKAPVIVEDTALYFQAWNKLPGPLIKWFMDNLGNDGLVKALGPFEDKRAEAICAIGYTDGTTTHICRGKVQGKIVSTRGNNGFGWDKILMPDGYDVTFGEMETYQKHQISMRKLAVEELKNKLFNGAN